LDLELALQEMLNLGDCLSLQILEAELTAEGLVISAQVELLIVEGFVNMFSVSL
jgi:hypothetical protein